MQEFRSADWYRIAGVRIRLADHIQARRQTFRAQVWYVLFDSLTQRTHRLTPQAWHVVARMDGKRWAASTILAARRQLSWPVGAGKYWCQLLRLMMLSLISSEGCRAREASLA